MSTEQGLLRPALAVSIALAIGAPGAAAPIGQDPVQQAAQQAEERRDDQGTDPIGPAGPERPRTRPQPPLPDPGADPAGGEPEGAAGGDDPFGDPFGGPAAPREAGEGGGRLWLSTSIELGAAHDTGLETGAGEEVGEDVYEAVPTVLLLARPSERAELSIGYQPEIERFPDRPELDAVHHAAGALYRFSPSERTLIQGGASWLDGEDPSRHLDGLVLLLPRTPYRQGRAHLDLERRWQRTALRFHVSRTDTLIEPAGALLPVGVDQTDDAGALGLEWSASRRTVLTASYSYVDPTQDPELVARAEAGELPPPVTAPVQSLLLGFSREMSRRVVLDLAAGWLRQDRSALERAAGADDGSWLASGEIRRLGDVLSLRLRYDHSLLTLGPGAGSGPITGPGGGVPTPAGALRDSVAHTATFSFELEPARWVRWQQRLWATRAELDGGDDLDAWAATTRLVFPAGDRFGLYARLDYFDQAGFGETGLEPAGPGPAGSDPTDVSRTRWSAGVIVGLGGPPSTWGLREEPTLLLRTLRPGID